MQDEVLRIWQARRTTMLLVTHDIDEALYIGERVYVIASNPGRVRTIIDVPFGASRGPAVKRDRRFLDLRDEIDSADLE